MYNNFLPRYVKKVKGIASGPERKEVKVPRFHENGAGWW
jgi:hypothetical protein